MKIEKPCSVNVFDGYVQIKDRLGDVIAVCNDAATADEIRDIINNGVDPDDVKEKLLEELFT